MKNEKDSNMATAIILLTLLSMNQKQRPLVSFAVPIATKRKTQQSRGNFCWDRKADQRVLFSVH